MSDTKSEQVGVGPALAALHQEMLDHTAPGLPLAVQQLAVRVLDALTPLIAQWETERNETHRFEASIFGLLHEALDYPDDKNAEDLARMMVAALAASEARVQAYEAAFADVGIVTRNDTLDWKFIPGLVEVSSSGTDARRRLAGLLRQVGYVVDGQHRKQLESEAARQQMQQERDRLRTALVGLVGATERAELEELEAVMRVLPAPAEDKAKTIDAIHALIATVQA